MAVIDGSAPANYAPIAVGVVLLYAGIFWFVSARKWFTGPRARGDEVELEAIEARLEAAEKIEAVL